MAVTVVLFGLTLLISPSAIIGIGLLGFAWLGLIRATAEGSIVVKGMSYIILSVVGGRGRDESVIYTLFITRIYMFDEFVSKMMCALSEQMHAHVVLFFLSIFFSSVHKQGLPLPKNRPRLPCREYPSWC